MNPTPARVVQTPFDRAVKALLNAKQATLLLTVCLLSPPAIAASPLAQAKTLNGTWIVKPTPATATPEQCQDYLPAGTRLQLNIDDLTDAAIAQNTHRQFRGFVSVRAPLDKKLCGTGLGLEVEDDANLCDGGEPLESDEPIEIDATFDIVRLTKAQIKSETFLARIGARPAAELITISVPTKNVQWRFWRQGPDVMHAECAVGFPGKGTRRSFAVTWQRQSRQVLSP